MFIGCKNIHKTYIEGNVKTEVLKGINLEIKYNEFVAIMGSSGSGKSTLLYILGLLDDINKGEIIYDDEVLSKKKPEEKTRIRLNYIGYIFQDFYLIDEMKLYENVALSGIASGMKLNDAYKHAKELLLVVGLAKHANKKPTQLSGGQKQRVAIARALMNNPLVLYADEPTANLDSKTSMEIFNLFKKLQKELKLTIIMVTHETYFQDKVDRVIKIKDGEIVT